MRSHLWFVVRSTFSDRILRLTQAPTGGWSGRPLGPRVVPCTEAVSIPAIAEVPTNSNAMDLNAGIYASDCIPAVAEVPTNSNAMDLNAGIYASAADLNAAMDLNAGINATDLNAGMYGSSDAFPDFQDPIIGMNVVTFRDFANLFKYLDENVWDDDASHNVTDFFYHEFGYGEKFVRRFYEQNGIDSFQIDSLLSPDSSPNLSLEKSLRYCSRDYPGAFLPCAVCSAMAYIGGIFNLSLNGGTTPAYKVLFREGLRITRSPGKQFHIDAINKSIRMKFKKFFEVQLLPKTWNPLDPFGGPRKPGCIVWGVLSKNRRHHCIAFLPFEGLIVDPSYSSMRVVNKESVDIICGDESFPSECRFDKLWTFKNH